MARINTLYNTSDPNARVRDVAPRAPRPSWQQRTNDTLGVIQNVANSPLTALAIRGGQEIKHGLEDAQLREMDAAAEEYRKLSAGRGLNAGEIAAPAPTAAAPIGDGARDPNWVNPQYTTPQGGIVGRDTGKDPQGWSVPAGMAAPAQPAGQDASEWAAADAAIESMRAQRLADAKRQYAPLANQSEPTMLPAYTSDNGIAFPEMDVTSEDPAYKQAAGQAAAQAKWATDLATQFGAVPPAAPAPGSIAAPRLSAPSAAGLDVASMAPTAPVAAPATAPVAAPEPTLANATDDQLTTAAMQLQKMRDALPPGDPRAATYGERLGFVNEELTMRQRMAQVNKNRPLEYEQLLEMARTATTPQAQASTLAAIARTRFPVSSVGDMVGNAQERQAAADIRGLFPATVVPKTPQQLAADEADLAESKSRATKNTATADRIKLIAEAEKKLKESQANKNLAGAGESASRNALRTQQEAKAKAEADQIARLVDDREKLLQAQAARTSAAVAKLRRGGGGGAGKPKGPKLAEVNAGIKAEVEQRQAELTKTSKDMQSQLDRLRDEDDRDARVDPPGNAPAEIDINEATEKEVEAYQKALAKHNDTVDEFNAARARRTERATALTRAQTELDDIRTKERTIRADVDQEFAQAKQDAKVRLGVVRGAAPTQATAPTAPAAPAAPKGPPPPRNPGESLAAYKARTGR